ncbi:MAG: TAT-variant-translocated molybdopterin oxidoreductase [Anaerolineae bacterium]
MPHEPLDLATVRAHLAQKRGQHYWRSLEELADTEEFQDFLYREFPRQASEWPNALSRRHFLKLMGASLALAGLTACSSQPPEEIVPYVEVPEGVIPGQPLFFATAMTLGGYARGLLVESHLNRPTKIEGNPDHPASLGATDALAQASILTLYDPDRSQSVTRQGQGSTWTDFLNELQPELERQRASQGAGLRILTETVTSPSLTAQLQTLLAQFPAAVWHQYEPINRDNVRAGAQLAFGEAVEPIYHFDRAEVILSLEADFFSTFPGSVRYARDFAAQRRAILEQAGNLSHRLYVIESTPTVTGVMADHRLALKAVSVESFARAVAQAVGVSVTPGDEAALNTIPENWVSAIARDLQAHQGRSIVITGDHQPPLVHALAHAINEALGNVGQTITYLDPVTSPASQTDSLGQLAQAMAAGQVELLLILGGNPVYTAPADLNFAEALDKVKLRLHLGLYEDETSERCQWHVPESHYLEAWSDARAYDGTITIMQPLIAPLYDSRSIHQVVAALLGQADPSGHDVVRGYWESQPSGGDFNQFWQTTLIKGVMADTALAAKTVSIQPEFATQPAAPAAGADDLELTFRPAPSLWDGRFANNGWLQELPQPLTKLTWDNAALLSPATAEKLGLANEEVVELQYQGRTVRAPVWLMPGQAEDSVTVYLGYGRTRAGRVGSGVGFNAYALRPAGSPWFGGGLKLVKTGERYPLATTQMHQTIEGRDLVRVGTLEQFRTEPDFAHKAEAHALEISLYPKFEYNDNAWGMVVDLNACNGCNACVVACQAENNIPIVGKEEMMRGREMHWLRLDRYYQGDLDNPEIYQQPVMCMQCENAPCEVVCPVGATMHDHEGLNVMVYNRCIGTRYCSNNCPYKVRRFNFLQFTDLDTESLKLQRNPEVTVRSRGVMEKCTYCVQRISAARIAAKKENRPIRDGEAVTACQAACPTQAIVFGNLNDPNSQVAKLKASPLNYGLLTELNTHPRTTYLAKLRNPNPELEGTTS